MILSFYESMKFKLKKQKDAENLYEMAVVPCFCRALRPCKWPDSSRS